MRRIALSLLAASVLISPSMAVEPVREGTGARRAQLNKMELQPFDFGELTSLEEWVGEPVGESDIGGKVVLVVTWASWYPVSVRALPAAQSLAKRYGDQGLVVVGVHHPDGWDEAEKLVEQRRITFPVAYDQDGSFREALLVDQDPDYYIIDRAGQLRYADVDAWSVEAAVKELLGESSDHAGSLKDRMAEAKRQADVEFSKTGGINEQADLSKLPPLPFAPPSPEAYEDAKWPKEPKDENNRYRQDTGPRKAVLPPPTETWAPAFPNLNGKAVVVYYWHPASWRSTRQSDMMDLLQRRYMRDVQVIGVLTAIPEDTSNRDPDAQSRNDPEELNSRFNRLVKSQEFVHAMTIDLSRNSYNSVNPEGQQGNRGLVAVPYAGVISSDGVVRWWGYPGTSAFDAAIEQVIKVDPGIKARQKAEEAYLKAKQGK